MSHLLEAVAHARDHRAEAEAEFRSALVRAHAPGPDGQPLHSFAAIAAVAGLSSSGVHYLAANLNERRKGKR